MTSERKLRVGSTFSGVGGADLGLERAGFELAWTCEWDEWKRSILHAHWPNVPHHEDIRDLNDPPEVDLLVGGFPCQDLSVAGKRRGFDGERSVLAFEFLRVAESLRPRWLLMENVPGLLSSNGGRDLARLLDELGAIGYGGWAYRILDARYFGVPQRRRRVFICARRTDPELDTRAAAGLALRALWEGSGGDPTPGWPPREITPTRTGAGATSSSSVGVNGAASEAISNAVTKKWSKGTGGPAGDECQNLVSFYPTGGSQNGFWDTTGVSPTIKVGSSVGAANGIAIADVTNRGGQTLAFRKQRRAASVTDDETWVADDAANTLNAFDTGDTRTTHAIVNALDRQAGGPGDNSAQAGHLIPQTFPIDDGRELEKHQNGTGIGDDGAPAYTLDRQQRPAVAQPEQMSVRRLTPIECERLMGWPDNWTAPPGVKAPDSKRYAACGDGIVSWVAYWIGMRIQMIESENE